MPKRWSFLFLNTAHHEKCTHGYSGIVYIQSMTLFLTIFQGSLMAKCHWPKSMTHGHKPDVHNQTVIDQSMTLCKGAGCTMVSAKTFIGQWHFGYWTSGLWPCVIDFGQWHLAMSEPWKIVKKSVIDWMYTMYTIPLPFQNFGNRIIHSRSRSRTPKCHSRSPLCPLDWYDY